MPSEGQLAGVSQGAVKELYLFFSGEKHDNLVTTMLNAPAGYHKAGTVGVVLAEPVHGTAPLWLYFNAKLNDHLTCAAPGTVAYAKANGYELVQNNPIGYVYAAPEWVESMQ